MRVGIFFDEFIIKGAGEKMKTIVKRRPVKIGKDRFTIQSLIEFVRINECIHPNITKYQAIEGVP